MGAEQPSNLTEVVCRPPLPATGVRVVIDDQTWFCRNTHCAETAYRCLLHRPPGGFLQM